MAHVLVLFSSRHGVTKPAFARRQSWATSPPSFPNRSLTCRSMTSDLATMNASRRAWLNGLSPSTGYDPIVLEIAAVESACCYEDSGFSSASFVVRTHAGRRFHLQCAI